MTDEQADLRLQPPPRSIAFGRRHIVVLKVAEPRGRIGRGSFVAVVLLTQLSWLGTLGYLAVRLL